MEDYKFNLSEMNIIIEGFEVKTVVKKVEKPKE